MSDGWKTCAVPIIGIFRTEPVNFCKNAIQKRKCSAAGTTRAGAACKDQGKYKFKGGDDGSPGRGCEQPRKTILPFLRPRPHVDPGSLIGSMRNQWRVPIRSSHRIRARLAERTQSKSLETLAERSQRSSAHRFGRTNPMGAARAFSVQSDAGS